jgi:polyketide cyclase/dehydrase/lipid transport protein
MEQSRVIPVALDTAFNGTLPMPLPTLFGRWYGPIAPVRAVRDQTGDWSAAGQARTVVQVGGTMRETLTAVEPPHMFGYTLSQVTGALAPLVDHIDGRWLFTPAPTGTNVTWRWSVHPRSTAARLAMPAFAKLWRGFATQSLDRLCRELVL